MRNDEPQPPANFTALAFTDSVKRLQREHGSRDSYARMEASGDRFLLTDVERLFIEARDSFYLASVGENGWPYVQYRGGPPGFLRVLDDNTLAFADFRGNRQYISAGNVTVTPKVAMILMDYAERRRLKIWAEVAQIAPADDAELAARVDLGEYAAVIERIFVFQIRGYDWNCPQHITPRLTLREWERSELGGSFADG